MKGAIQLKCIITKFIVMMSSTLEYSVSRTMYAFFFPHKKSVLLWWTFCWSTLNQKTHMSGKTFSFTLILNKMECCGEIFFISLYFYIVLRHEGIAWDSYTISESEKTIHRFHPWFIRSLWFRCSGRGILTFISFKKNNTIIRKEYDELTPTLCEIDLFGTKKMLKSHRHNWAKICTEQSF